MSTAPATSDAGIERYVNHRVRVAVAGMTLAGALLLTTFAPWVADAAGGSSHWSLWELFSTNARGDVVTEAEQAWGHGMAILLVLTLVAVIVAAAEATVSWLAAAGASAAATFALEVAFRIGARENIVGHTYHYSTAQAGATAAMWITALLVLGAALGAWAARDLGHGGPRPASGRPPPA